MAVMASSPADGVAVDQKTVPVPAAADVIAVEAGVNGSTQHHPTLLDARPALPDTPNQALDLSPSDDRASNPATRVNGDANKGAYLANKARDTPPAEAAVDAPSHNHSFASVERNDSLQLQSSNTTTTTTTDDRGEFANSLSNKTEHLVEATNAQVDDDLFGHDESVATTHPDPIHATIDAAVEATATVSTSPPVILAPESDLRHTSPRPASETAPASQEANFSVVNNTQEQPHQLLESLDNFTAIESASVTEVIAPADHDLALTNADRPPVADDQRAPASPSTLVPNADALLQTESQESRPLDTNMSSDDVEMADAPAPTIKVAREREDDAETGPSAKRAKTEDGPVSEIPAALEQNGGGGPISLYMEKEIVKILKNAMRTKIGMSFAKPVIELWPVIAEPYAAKVPNPIDLGTIEQKLKAKTYQSIDGFYADLKLLEDNTVLFNGPEHEVTQQARGIRGSLCDKISKVGPEPPAKVAAVKAPKKATPRRGTPVADPIPQPAAAPAAAAPRPAKPTAGAATRTFALDPSTSTPVIRRDSMKDENGRPKRAIKQPKNKDLAYHSVRPKSKKYGPELRFCEEVLNEVKKGKHNSFVYAFLDPVDPIALNIPHYFTIIKNPMDISTVTRKLQAGEYIRAADFKRDLDLIVKNCRDFNPVGNPVREQANKLEALVNEQWTRKDEFVASHGPAAVTPASSDAEESEEEIEEPAPVVKENPYTQRLVEEQAKLIQLMASGKNADPGVVQFQQQIVNMVQRQVDDQEAAIAASRQAPRKKAKAPKPKKPAPVKRSNTASGAKKGGHARGGRKSEYMGTLEKEIISSGISNLPDYIAQDVMQWVAAEVPDAEQENGEMELDIEALSVPTLWKIYHLIQEHSPQTEAEVRAQYAEPKSSPEEFARPAPKKKNKPMNKWEQEAKISALQENLRTFAAPRQGSGSQEPVIPTIEDESSGDEDESDSEED